MTKRVLFGSALLILFGVVANLLVRLDSQRLLESAPVMLLILGTVGVLASVLARWALGEARSDRLFTNLLVSVAATLVMLILAEHGLRFAVRAANDSPGTGTYYTNRWRHDLRTNRLGFRERVFRISKPDDVYRIAVIGDSLTFGQGVLQDDRYTRLLEIQLNKGGREYEVLNFGSVGTETVHHVAILQHTVLGINPDYVLLQWFTNDVEGDDRSGRPYIVTLFPHELREVSLLFSAMHLQVNRAWQKLSGEGSYEEYMVERFMDPNSPASLEADRALREFIQVCQDHNIPLGIVIFGQYHSEDSSFDFLLERVLTVCEEEEIQCLDLRDTFAPYKGDWVLWANWGDHHPSTFAHELVAETVMEAFGDVWQANSLEDS